MRHAIAVILLVAAAGLWAFRHDLSEYLGVPVLTGSPYEGYAAAIRRRDLDKTHLGREWLAAGREAVDTAIEAQSPFEGEGSIGDGGAGAVAWRFAARRGQRITVHLTFTAGRMFVDLLHCSRTCEPVASKPDDSATLAHEVREDRDLVLRLQPELLRSGPYAISQRAEATLEFPIAGLSAGAVQSMFGAERDRGRRSHEGVDIFAPRGTPVVAAVDGFVTGSTTNRLGGNVVWLWSPLRRIALYYAHLERQAVRPGDSVAAGEIVGWVGNTGNARGTAPHLHFGVYARPGGAVDPLPYICDAPCAPSRRQTGRP